VIGQADVVVIGGGLAGLACANRCAEHGFRTLVLEAGEDDRYLCNSRVAMGFFNVAMQDIARGPEALREAIDQVTRGHADPALADVLAWNAAPSLAWLKRQGVRLIIGGRHPANRAMLAPPAAIRPGLHWAGRGADVMLRRLEANLIARGGRLHRGARAVELMMDRRRCGGVMAVERGQRRAIHADAVVLADGGFQGNADLLRLYITPHPERLLQRNTGTGRGDGLLMAQAAGAMLTPMDRFYGHVQARDAMLNPLLWPYPTVDLPITAGIAVNRHGQRFADEGLGGVYLANMIARLDDPLEAVAIFDHATWTGRARSFILPANPHLVKQGATIHVAEKIADLAALAGLPAAGLIATVNAHNDAIANCATDALIPSRSTTPYTPEPINKPPYYAVPLCAGITYTMGGIAIDAAARVCHVTGGTFQGLFAAGSTTGGHEGGPFAGYTAGLIKALTFGLQAAETIAADSGALAAAAQ
jgi:fumarate reductase flavoprotein subunit